MQTAVLRLISSITSLTLPKANLIFSPLFSHTTMRNTYDAVFDHLFSCPSSLLLSPCFIYLFITSVCILPGTQKALEKCLQSWIKVWRVCQHEAVESHSARARGYRLSWDPSNYILAPHLRRQRVEYAGGYQIFMITAHLDGAKDLPPMEKGFSDHRKA